MNLFSNLYKIHFRPFNFDLNLLFLAQGYVDLTVEVSHTDVKKKKVGLSLSSFVLLTREWCILDILYTGAINFL